MKSGVISYTAQKDHLSLVYKTQRLTVNGAVLVEEPENKEKLERLLGLVGLLPNMDILPQQCR